MKTLIFDFDGTLADSFETFLEIFDEVVPRPQKLTTQEVQELRGKPLKDVIKYLKIKRWQIPRLLLRGKRLVAVKITKIRPFAGLPAVIKELQAGGYQMFIVSTNSSPNISKFLKTNDLDSCFIKIYGDIGLRSKSSAIRRILRKEKLRAGNCVYIGDEVRDIEAARKAGVEPVAVSWGFNTPAVLSQAKPTALAHLPRDLLKILD